MDIPDYQLLRRIGKGGYGEVWLARALTGEYRALKIVQRERFDEDKHYEREFHGIQAYSPVSRSHPSLIPVYHVGRNDERGFFYYVMELADDLTGEHPPDHPGYTPHTLAATQTPGKPLPFEITLTTGSALADALAHLHDAGLIHRDLKPANIVYLKGQPRLADPGLVAQAGATTLVGTLGYLPPEGPGHPSADCFALGKLLYEISTGQNHAAFPRLPEIARTPDWPREARRLNQVITTACAIDPTARYESATDLAEDIRRVDTRRPARQRRRTLALAATLTLTATGLWFAFANNSTPSKIHSENLSEKAIPKPPPQMAPMEFPPPKRVIYVRPKATGKGNGWANALGDLHTALALASPGDEIRLAGGVYKPSQTGDRTATFALPAGVRLRGGFSGNGNEQNRHQHPTILSGDLKGNDNETIHRTEPTRADNTIHLLTLLPGDTPTLIEGLTFTSANADTIGTHNPKLNGAGAGILLKESHLTLRQCRFQSLTANSAASLWDSGHSKIHIDHCEFIANLSHRGGTVMIGSGSQFEIQHSLFLKNQTTDSPTGYQWGGGLYLGLGSIGNLYRSVFAKNFAWESGGGIYSEGDTRVIRCTFYRNRSSQGQAVFSSEKGFLKLWDCLFADADSIPNEITSLRAHKDWGSHKLKDVKQLSDPNDIIGADKIFNTFDDGLRFRKPKASPLVGAY